MNDLEILKNCNSVAEACKCFRQHRNPKGYLFIKNLCEKLNYDYNFLNKKFSYDLNPKKCKFCNTKISFFEKNKDFCNSSCSASFNNKGRTRSEESRNKTRCSLLNNHYKKITTYIDLICNFCKKDFQKRPCRSKAKFCSRSCAAKYHVENSPREIFVTYGKMSASSRVKRSKNEIYFYELCKNIFTNVDHNKSIFNNWDADIIIHDLKIAILWNGKWHYEKITKQHSLSQVQNRDIIKMKEIVKYGYTPYIVKDMGKHKKSFVDEEFIKFNKYLTENNLLIAN